jgi:hypothetical protein
MNTGKTEKRFRVAENALRKSGPLQIIRHLFRTLPGEGQADSAQPENQPGFRRQIAAG